MSDVITIKTLKSELKMDSITTRIFFKMSSGSFYTGIRNGFPSAIIVSVTGSRENPTYRLYDYFYKLPEGTTTLKYVIEVVSKKEKCMNENYLPWVKDYLEQIINRDSHPVEIDHGLIYQMRTLGNRLYELEGNNSIKELLYRNTGIKLYISSLDTLDLIDEGLFVRNTTKVFNIKFSDSGDETVHLLYVYEVEDLGLTESRFISYIVIQDESENEYSLNEVLGMIESKLDAFRLL